MLKKHRVLSSSIALLAVGPLAATTAAATYNWNVNQAASDWGTALNWAPNSAFPNAVGDIVNLTNNITVTNTITLNGSYTIGVLNLGDTDGSHGFTLNRTANNGLTLSNDAGNAAINQLAGSGANTVAVPLTGLTSLGISNASSASLTISGALSLGTNSLSVSGNGTTSISGALTGSGALNKSGSGTLVLGGGAADSTGNTYSGSTVVTSGVLQLNKANGVAAISSGNIALNGGTLQFGSAGAARNDQLPDATTLTVSSGGLVWNDANETLGAITATGGNLNAGSSNRGTVQITGALSLTGGAALTLDGGGQWSASSLTMSNTSTLALAGNGSRLTQVTTGPGGLTLNGRSISLNSQADAGGSPGSRIVLGGDLSSSLNSSIVVTNAYGAGDLDLNGTRMVNVTNNVLTIGAAIINGGIVKTGPGALVLSNAANTFTGGLTIMEGVLTIDGDNKLGPTANVIALNGGTLSYSNNVTDYTPVPGRMISVGANGGAFSVSLRRALIDQPNVFSGSGRLTKSGTNTLQITQPQDSFSGPVTVSQGFLQLASNVLENAGPITLAGGGLSGSGTTPNDLVLSGGILAAQGGAHTYSGDVLVNSASTIQLADGAGFTARNIQITGRLSGSGAFVVSRGSSDPNTGVLTISNPRNDFTGTITVNQNLTVLAQPAGGIGNVLGGGTVNLAGGRLHLRDDTAGSYGNNIAVLPNAGGGQAGSGATIDVNNGGSGTGGVFALGALTIGDQTLTVSGGNNYAVTFSGPATLTGSSTLNPTTANLSLLGGVHGSGASLTKTGAGTLIIGGTSSNLAANITINAGALQFNRSASIPGAGASILVNAAGLVVANYGATQSNFLARIRPESGGTAAVGVSTEESFDFSNHPTLRFGALGEVELGGQLVANGTYRLGGSGTLVLASANALSGANSLDIAGGAVALRAANSLTGGISIGPGGTLQAGSATALGSGSITGNGGTFRFEPGTAFPLFDQKQVVFGAGGFTLDTNGNNFTAAGISGGGGTGAFTKTGAGTLTLGGTVSYPGLTRIGGGVLAFADGSRFGASSSIAFSGGVLRMIGSGTRLAKPVTVPSTGPSAVIDVPEHNGSLEITGTIMGGTAGNTVLTKTGAGQLLLAPSGASNDFSGNVLVKEGDLAVRGAGGNFPTPGLSANSRLVTLDGGGFRLDSGLFNPNPNTVNFVIAAGGGTIDVNGGATMVLDDGTGNTGTLAGAAQLQGSGALTKTGPGILQLGFSGQTTNGFSAYTGEITVANGTLQVGHQNALGDAVASTRVLAGATIDVRNNSASNEPLFIRGDGFGGIGVLVNNGPSGGILGGNVTLEGHSRLGGSNTLTINGPVSGAFDLTKVGSGTLQLGGTNAYTGRTVLRAGTLTLAGANGAAGSTSGIVIHSLGTFILDNSAAVNGNRIGDSTPIRFEGAQGRFELRGSTNVSPSISETVGQVELASDSSGTVRVGSLINPPATTLQIAGLTRGDRSMVFVQASNEAALGTTERLLASSAPALVNGIVPVWIQSGSSATFLTYDSTAGFRGATYGSSNLLTSTASSVVDETTSRTITNSSAYAVRVGNTAVLSGGTLTISGGGLLLTPSGVTPFTHSTNLNFSQSGVPREAIIRSATSLQTNLTGTITASALVRGGGTVAFGANNSATLGSAPVTLLAGDTILNAPSALGNGTVRLQGGDLRLNVDSALANNHLIQNGGVLNLRRDTSGTFTMASLTLSGAVRIDVNNLTSGSAQTLSVGNVTTAGETQLQTTGGNSFRLETGRITMTGGDLLLNVSSPLRVNGLSDDSNRKLTKTGGAALEIAGSSDYRGGTEILVGNVVAGADAALGLGPVMLGDLGGVDSVRLDLTSGRTLANPITVRAGTMGSLTLGSQNGATGTMSFTGPLLLGQNVTLNADGADATVVFSGKISGRGRITKIGAGVLVLGNTGNDFNLGTSDAVLISTGVLAVSSDGAFGAAGNGVTLIPNATLRLNDGFSGERNFFINSGSANVDVPGGGQASLGGNLTGSGTYVKTGGGVLNYDGTAVNTASLVVSGGTLNVNGSVAGAISVSAGATLGGNGLLGSALTVAAGATAGTGGTISPGQGIGTLDLANSLTFGANSKLRLELGGVEPGMGAGKHDQLNLTSSTASLTLDGSTALELSLAPGYVPNFGDAFFVLTRADAGAFASFFADTTENGLLDLGGGVSARITYLANWSGSAATSTLVGGNDVAIYIVPEPGTASLSLAAALAFLGFRRHRRR